MSSQIKSKERVAQHGEVFTNEREVNAMLDYFYQQYEELFGSLCKLYGDVSDLLWKTK